MQKASPPGAASQQQQAIMKIMPLFFGFIGFTFPAGLVVYWTTSNLFQIGQQTLAPSRRPHRPRCPREAHGRAAQKQAQKGRTPEKKGFFGSHARSSRARATSGRMRRLVEGRRHDQAEGTGERFQGQGWRNGVRGLGSKGSGSAGRAGASPGRVRVARRARPATPPVDRRNQDRGVAVAHEGEDRRSNDRAEEDLEAQADAAADFLDELLGYMDIDAIAEPNLHGDHMYVDIVDGPEDDLSSADRAHGQTLEAIQELTRMAVARRLDQRVRVIVDVEDYRKQREERLEERARELAERALETGREQELEPMNSYERKLVHDAAAAVGGVETSSRGEEPASLRRDHAPLVRVSTGPVRGPVLTAAPCPPRYHAALVRGKACFT